jgi:hypothetical protein
MKERKSIVFLGLALAVSLALTSSARAAQRCVLAELFSSTA